MNKTLILSIGFISVLVTTNATAMLIPSLKRATYSPQKVKSVSQKRNVMYVEDRDTIFKRDIDKRTHDYEKEKQRRELHENIRTCDKRIENYVDFYAKHKKSYISHRNDFEQKAMVYTRIYDAIALGYSNFPRLQKFMMPSPDEAMTAHKAKQQAEIDMNITKLHLDAAYAKKFRLQQQLRYIE